VTPSLFTVGHSTRTLDDFVALLQAHGVTRLADVRTIPKSRRHPHFAGDALARALAAHGIEYRHFRALGGLRKPRRDSRNTGWRNESFRGYADYMETDEFEAALDDLIEWAASPALPPAAQDPATAIMCAEAVWWRCHRQLIADALVARGIGVRHILSATPSEAHALTAIARVGPDRHVTYPGLV
jgi:uncharacterized protein (DUF488 family)